MSYINMVSYKIQVHHVQIECHALTNKNQWVILTWHLLNQYSQYCTGVYSYTIFNYELVASKVFLAKNDWRVITGPTIRRIAQREIAEKIISRSRGGINVTTILVLLIQLMPVRFTLSPIRIPPSTKVSSCQ